MDVSVDPQSAVSEAAPLAAVELQQVPEVRVNYRHYRYIPNGNGKPTLIRFMRNDLHPTNVLSKGGLTVCTIQVGDQFFKGEANCSLQDCFCYKVGRKLALSRALKAAHAAGAIG